MTKFPKPLVALIETSLNRYIALDPGANEVLVDLNNRIISLKIREFDSTLFFRIEDTQILTLTEVHQEVDVKMVSSLLALVQISLLNRSDESLLGTDFEMSGNMEVGRQFRNIFKLIDIDWEEIISKYTGDIVAHKLGNGFRVINNWIDNTSDTLRRDISEYLQEESQQLPTQNEVNIFNNQVDEIRNALDRAEAKIRIIKSNLEHVE